MSAVQGMFVEVSDAAGTHYRVWCSSRQMELLRSGDVAIESQATPSEGVTAVERLTTLGQRDECEYELFDWLLASKSKPA